MLKALIVGENILLYFVDPIGWLASQTTMIQNFGGDGLNHTAQWFESNKYGLNDTTELAVWFESRQTA